MVILLVLGMQIVLADLNAMPGLAEHPVPVEATVQGIWAMMSAIVMSVTNLVIVTVIVVAMIVKGTAVKRVVQMMAIVMKVVATVAIPLPMSAGKSALALVTAQSIMAVRDHTVTKSALVTANVNPGGSVLTGEHVKRLLFGIRVIILM